jgi:hypothetical protein
VFIQARRGHGLPFGTAIRYRAIGGRWHAGEAAEIRNSELMFLCNTPFELHSEVEVILPAKVQVMASESAVNLLCSGRIVRRFLANWPELRSAMVVSISHCQIESEPGDADAA